MSALRLSGGPGRWSSFEVSVCRMSTRLRLPATCGEAVVTGAQEASRHHQPNPALVSPSRGAEGVSVVTRLRVFTETSQRERLLDLLCEHAPRAEVTSLEVVQTMPHPNGSSNVHSGDHGGCGQNMVSRAGSAEGPVITVPDRERAPAPLEGQDVIPSVSLLGVVTPRADRTPGAPHPPHASLGLDHSGPTRQGGTL